jgi:hypothetical protein
MLGYQHGTWDDHAQLEAYLDGHIQKSTKNTSEAYSRAEKVSLIPRSHEPKSPQPTEENPEQFTHLNIWLECQS